MVARFQRWIALALGACAVAWVAAFTAAGHWGWAAAGAATMALAHGFFLAAEFLALFVVQTSETAPRPGIGQLLRAWGGELLWAPRIFLWQQPYRSYAEPDFLPATPGGSRGVVLVHGLLCNRGFWNVWMRQLRARSLPFVAINLEPLSGSIAAYAARIEAAVSRVEKATGRPAVLVGHSMGGLAIRAWYARQSEEGRVHRIVTIGTPHHGTWLARFGGAAIGNEMRIGNPWLASLESLETPGRYARFVCFHGHCDNAVFPTACAVLPGACNIHVPATAHVHMAFRPLVFDTVCRALE